MTSYLEVLKELRNGATLVDLSEKMTDVVAAVRNVGKAGKVTLELTIKPFEKSDDIRILVLEEKIKTEIPQKDRNPTVFYSSHENVLSRQDPEQLAMELKVVDMPLRDGRKVLWRDVLLTEMRQKWERVEDAPAPRLRRARVEG